MTIRLALDQNFPDTIIRALEDSFVEVELRPVRLIDPRLSVLDDWQLLLALHHHPDGYAGMITADARMLGLSRELATLQQTGFSLIVAEGSGHDPLKATGLVLTHLSHVAGQIDRKKPRIWMLSSRAPLPRTPRDYLGELASRAKVSAAELFAAAKVDDATLGRDPLVGRRR